MLLFYTDFFAVLHFSYDGRAGGSQQGGERREEENILLRYYQDHHPDDTVPESIQNNFKNKQGKHNNKENSWLDSGITSSERLSLDGGGKTLVIKFVQKDDQAEYRCIVHYKRSPVATQRMQLTVVGKREGAPKSM